MRLPHKFHEISSSDMPRICPLSEITLVYDEAPNFQKDLSVGLNM